MRPNKLKEIWKSGDYVANSWLHSTCSWIAEVMAHQGFDSVTIDMQHGFSHIDAALPMLQAISTTDAVPLVRVPWYEAGIIGRSLDAGAYGVICPMVNTAEECAQFVGACRYHPDGYRSRGPTRARIYGGSDYAQHANQEIIAMAMVETRQSLKNIEEIVAVPHLDAVYIGPGDLSLSLDLDTVGIDNEDPIFIEAMETVAAACKAAGVVAGIHTASASYARKMIEMGFQFVTLNSDTALLGAAARAAVGDLRGTDVDRSASVY